MMPLEDSVKDMKFYYKRKLKWYEKIWYFLTGKKEEYQELRGNKKVEIKVKEIMLVFENCEECVLEPKMFKGLILNGIKENINVNCYQYKEGEANKNKSCDYFYILVNEEGQKALCFDEYLKTRISKSDLVAVILIYEDDVEETIYLPWYENDEYINRYQKNTIDDEGNLGICVEGE